MDIKRGKRPKATGGERPNPRVAIVFTEEQHAQISKFADSEGRSFSTVVRKLVDIGLASVEPPKPKRRPY